MSRSLRLTAVAIAWLAAACASVNAPAPLPSAQLQQLFFGSTLRGGSQGARWTIYVAPDGAARIVGTSADGRPFEDRGRFWLQGNTVCRQWSQLQEGKPFCPGFIARQADAYGTYAADGSPQDSFTLQPGNPDRL